jgi:hypothetical protein
MVLGAIRGGFENIMFNFGEPVLCWSVGASFHFRMYSLWRNCWLWKFDMTRCGLHSQLQTVLLMQVHQHEMTPVGFEPTQLALVELESTPLDHSGKVSMNVVLFHHVRPRWKLFSLSLRDIS